MTLEQLKTIQEQFITALKEYKDGQDYDEIELEKVLDDTLCRLPRDIVYVEWYDRSQIQGMAENRKDLAEYDTEITEKLIDECMYNLWRADDSYMINEDIEETIEYTIKGE